MRSGFRRVGGEVDRFARRRRPDMDDDRHILRRGRYDGLEDLLAFRDGKEEAFARTAADVQRADAFGILVLDEIPGSGERNLAFGVEWRVQRDRDVPKTVYSIFCHGSLCLSV